MDECVREKNVRMLLDLSHYDEKKKSYIEQTLLVKLESKSNSK
jgi:hypothetical protein